MTRPVLPLRAVRGLFLERQHLASPRAQALTPRRLGRFVEDTGGLQMDSINVLERAHYLTVWSRFGPYDRARFDRLVYRRRLLFEYWAHAACLVPVSSLPWWRRAMLDYEVRHTGWSGLQRNAGVLREVRAAIREGGPMVAAELERRPRRGARGGWWAWRPVHHALHHLWMTGDLAIHSRRHFQKRFDLAERVLDAALAARPVTAEEFRRWHLERSLHAMGAVTEKDLGGYLTFPRAAAMGRRAVFTAMRERGEAVPVEVEGSRAAWWALARDLPALRRAGGPRPLSAGTTLLSPFDSLLWHRDRVVRLFGFEYRIEVYTPGPKRVHGYYTLPILHDGHLIGRLDAKTHRGEKRLEVLHAHFEPWLAKEAASPLAGEVLDPDAALDGVAQALVSLGTFVGAERITLGRVTPGRLRASLARRLRAAAAG